jgi:hypothetical protein
MAGRLAPASEVAGSEDIPYNLKKGVVCQFKNGKVCPPALWSGISSITHLRRVDEQAIIILAISLLVMKHAYS